MRARDAPMLLKPPRLTFAVRVRGICWASGPVRVHMASGLVGSDERQEVIGCAVREVMQVTTP